MKPIRNYNRKRRRRISKTKWATNKINKYMKEVIFPILIEDDYFGTPRHKTFLGI
jgi:hypothetical protein